MLPVESHWWSGRPITEGIVHTLGNVAPIRINGYYYSRWTRENVNLQDIVDARIEALGIAVTSGIGTLSRLVVIKGPLPKAADAIDAVKIREIERRVRSGETSFPLDTGAQLRAVAESFKNHIGVRLDQGKIDAARNIQRAGHEAINRLDRFDALTPAARQQLRDIVDSAF
jgi:hypothetical protein